MVLPISSAGFGGAGGCLPAQFAKSMSIAFSVFLAVEAALAGLRFYFLDIWGGVIMLLITGFGAYVVRYQFDLQWTIMFGITLFFYGLIHFVMMLERLIITWPGFPDIHSGDTRVVVRDIVLIIAPIVDWTICGLCWWIFRKATSSEQLFGTDSERQPLTRQGGGVYVRQASVNSTVNGSATGSAGFTPFAGQGRKLA